MSGRELHVVRVGLPAEGEERRRFRVINQNFEHLRDVIERLRLTNGLIDASLLDHGELQGLGDDDHTQYYEAVRLAAWYALRETLENISGTVSGDVLYHDGVEWVRLAKGTDDQVLTLDTGLPSWADVPEELPAGTQGDVLYYDGSDWVALGHGVDGEFLKTKGAAANPEWGTPDSGGTPPGDFDLLTDGVSSLVFAGGDVVWIIS